MTMGNYLERKSSFSFFLYENTRFYWVNFLHIAAEKKAV